MKLSFSLLLISLGMILTGCASVPMTSANLDAEAKTFVAAPGRANLYIVRGHGMGTAIIAQLQLDGRIAGALAPGTFVMLSVPPGPHTLAVQGAENVEQQQVDAEPGRNYFYHVNIRMGWSSGRPHIEPISDDEGRQGVESAKRAEGTSYE